MPRSHRGDGVFGTHTARMAIDEPGQRFAVTDGEKITVIQLG
jgi:hypothetical protein